MDASNGEGTQAEPYDGSDQEDSSSDSASVTSPSSCSSSKESSALPDKPTPTQGAINLLLSMPLLPAGERQMEAMSKLKRLEVRPLPESITTGQLKPEHNPRTSCFDTVSVQASWCAHTLCQRCEAFHQVLQASRDNPSSGISSSIMRASLCTTDCSSDSQRSGETAKLPLELVYQIVDHAIENMRETKDGNTVATLLHVSSAIRFNIVKAFTPIKLYDALADRPDQSTEVHLPEALVSFICPTIRWFLQDVSVLRRDSITRPKCASTDSIIFSTGVRVRNAGVSVTISPQKPNPAVPSITSARVYTLNDETFDVSKVGKLLVITLNHCKPELQDPKVGDCPPRIVNVHQRALSGLLSAPTEGIAVEIRLDLKASIEDHSSKWCSRTWKYVTRAS